LLHLGSASFPVLNLGSGRFYIVLAAAPRLDLGLGLVVSFVLVCAAAFDLGHGFVFVLGM